MVTPRLTRAQAANPGPSLPLSVANTTFDPLESAPAPPPGAPEFAALNGAQAASPLGKDYLLVQRETPITQAWRDALEALGAELLAVQSRETLLVRMPEGSGPTLDAQPEVPRWWGHLLPGYKPSWSIEPMLRGIVPPEFLQPDGTILLAASLHRGEDPAAVATALLARIRASDASCAAAEIAGLINPPQAAAHGDARTIMLSVSPSCSAHAIRQIARTEAVAFIAARSPAGTLSNDATWYAQTQVNPINAPPDGSIWFACPIRCRPEDAAQEERGLRDGPGVRSRDREARQGMKKAAGKLEFDRAAELRDRTELRDRLRYLKQNRVLMG